MMEMGVGVWGGAKVEKFYRVGDGEGEGCIPDI